ncbi:MAG: hypothetical protein U0Q11_17555 [Vicinamibacterales bacterium]
MPTPRGPVCLMPHCGYLSETSRMLAIRTALIARGTEVIVATHGGTHEQLLRTLGVPYDVVGPRMTDQRCRRMVLDGPGIGNPNQSMWSDDELRTYARAEAEYFRERGVSIAVTGFTLTALLSTRLAGIPLACEHAGSFVPPLWERSLVEAPLASPLPFTQWLPEGVRRRLANLGTNHVGLHCSGFNRVARELGVEGVPSFAQLLLGDVTIVTEIPEVLGVTAADLEAWRPARPGYRSSTRLRAGGPIFAELDVPLPADVDTFLNAGGPTIYVAMTSTTAAAVRSVVNALKPLGVRVLVAGTVHALSDLEDEQVMVGGVLPSHRVMPRVDIAVTAGGQGSVQCAMASGTPIVALPLHPEQDLNASLIEKQGAGHRMTFAHAATPRLAALVSRMLERSNYRDAARRIQALYSSVDGPGLAADAILQAVA